MFGALISGGAGAGAGARLQMLSEGYPMAPWEISQLDRHMLSYCVSLENTPTAVRILRLRRSAVWCCVKAPCHVVRGCRSSFCCIALHRCDCAAACESNVLAAPAC